MEAPVRTSGRVRDWALRLLLLVVSSLIGLITAEAAARVLYPISDGRDNVALDGRPLQGFVEPGTVYKQISNEYNALTTITPEGYRAPAVEDNPDQVFLGDSFTFGWGLADTETFPSLFCAARHVSCANLGLPSSGTLKQVERLEEFLTRLHWRPKVVKLFFFGMSTSFSAGNDFVDNYDRAIKDRTHGSAPAARTPAPIPQFAPGMAERIIGLQSILMRHFTLIRIAKYYAGPALKAMIVVDPGESRMVEALEATRQSLARLDALSRREGFAYEIYLIVPVQDLLRRSYEQTLRALNDVSPKAVVSTAAALMDAPTRYYYSFDGHLNLAGSKRVADFLVARDRGSP